MYRIGIYDDERTIAAAIAKMVEQHGGAEVQIYTHEEISDLEAGSGSLPDILILDIALRGKNGIDFVKSIRSQGKSCEIIFVTGYVEYVSDVFEVEPASLLLKPIQQDKLNEALDRAMERIRKSAAQFLEVWAHGQLVRIPYSDIVYVESDRRYLLIHQRRGTERIMMKMSELMKNLPDNFVSCHQSYTVNLDFVLRFSKDKVELTDERIIPVSRSRYPKAKEQILCYFTERMEEKGVVE